MRNIVNTNKAPAAIGPYSQAIVAEGKLLFVSGQLGLDPESGILVEGGVREQTIRAMENLTAILEAANSSLDKVIKVNVFLKNMSDFAVFNEIYGRYFPKEPPARAAIEVAGLPKDGLVEIECVALV